VSDQAGWNGGQHEECDLPDFNPIEQLFAKLKILLRTVAARTVGAHWNAIGHLLAAYSPGECSDYFANAEYRLPIREML
jgi:hypothetical protein